MSRQFTLIEWRQSLLITLTCCLLLVGCSAAPQATPTQTPVPRVTFTLSGASTALAVLKVLQPAFEAENPGYRLQILDSASTSGNSGAIKGIQDKVLDFGALTRALTTEQKAAGIKAIEFGRAAIAVFVHPKNNITNLSGKQIKDIFLGRVTNWSEVGGADLPIKLYIRQADENVTQKLREAYLGDAPFPVTAQELTSTTAILSAVNGTEGSIGYGGWPAVVAEKVSIKPVSVDGVAPTDPNYPVVNDLIIAYSSEREKDIQPLTNWLTSKAGQDALVKLGVIVVTAQ